MATDDENQQEFEEYWKMFPAKTAWGASAAILKRQNSGLRIHGTGTLFRIADEHFLITAGHVIEEAPKNLVFIPADGQELFPLRGEGFYEPKMFDVGAIRLSDDVAAGIEPSRFLQRDHISLQTDITNSLFCVIGFPEMMSTHKNGELKIIKYFQITYRFDGEAVFEEFDPNAHFLMGADLDEMIGVDGKPLKFEYPGGFRAEFPQELKGVSGGSVWRIADSPKELPKDSRNARLVAVETGVSQPKKCIKATRWGIVLGLLVKFLPDLRRVLDLWRPRIDAE